MTSHFKYFLSPDLWPKLTHVYTAAAQPIVSPREQRDTFTIATIGNRPSEKGIPETLDAYRILRARYGDKVRMLLACRDLPKGYRLPPGVTLYQTHRMSDDVKSSLYRAADVLVLPVYWDALNSFVEASAYGVPTITTRIHHDEAFVRHGVTGYLLDAPLRAYSEGYGTKWKGLDEFVADVVARRERGELRPVVDEVIDVVDGMISGAVDHLAMGRAARELHAERFSPEARNEQLKQLYAHALSGLPRSS